MGSKLYRATPEKKHADQKDSACIYFAAYDRADAWHNLFSLVDMSYEWKLEEIGSNLKEAINARGYSL